MAGGMFRKAAVDKVSSPEQLDLLMRVTSPIGWLALLTIGVCLVVVGVWSVVGSIPELVDGQGTLFRGERLVELKATMPGNLVQLEIRPGMVIKAGQVIARIRREQADLQQRANDQITIAKNDSMIATKQAEKETLQAQYNVQAGLVQQGLKPANALLDWRQKIIAVEGEINSLQQQNGALRSSLSALAELTAADGGRVVEVMKSSGDQVREGEPVLRMEPDTKDAAGRRFCGGNTHVILYVPAQLAGKVQPGQPARVSPLDVKKEEYGYILGKVEWISSYAASPDDMKEKLKNDQLVQTFLQSGGGAVFEARVCLELDPKNKANGFKWSSTGPNKPIDTGGACSASVVVDEKQPYTYIIPMVRRTVGL